MKYKKRNVAVLFMLLFSLLTNAHADEKLDAQLLSAIKYNKLTLFKTLLDKGANPNAILGQYSSDWVMCEAMHEDRKPFLLEALKHGANVNLRNQSKGVSPSFSAPIFCNFMHNKNAYLDTLELLLKHGADIDIVQCETCQPFPGNKDANIGPSSKIETPIMHAAGLGKWKSVDRLIELKLSNGQALRWQEKNYLIWTIETARPESVTRVGNQDRAKVTKRLRSLGIVLKPSIGREKSQIQLPDWGEPAVF